MESVTRWIFIAIAGVLAWIYIPKLMGGGGKDGIQPIGIGRTETAEYAFAAADPEKCKIEGKRFNAQYSARGAALVDYYLTGDPRYTEHGKPIELTTVPGSAPDRFDLHFDWRALGNTGETSQVAKDVVDWKLEPTTDGTCKFSYADDRVKLTKTIKAGDGPHELASRATPET